MPFSTEDLGWRGRVARFWRFSYAADYVGLVVLIVGLILVHFLLEPFHRMFSLDDRTKSFPHTIIERVSAGQNILYAGVGPLVILVIWALISRPGLHQTHETIFGLFVSLILTVTLTDIVKNTVGRPRPDLIARCKPRAGTPEHTLVTIDVCTETNHHTLYDGWRSFPSGHSSFAFAGFGYLALFMAGQMLVLRPRTDLARCLLCFLPLVAAALIAISRVEDYRHDALDVTAGSLLGISVAYFSYRRHYRSLYHRRCNVVYSTRAEFLNPIKKRMGRRHHDEEYQISSASAFELTDTDDERSEAMALTHEEASERDPH